jgi:hypothetical protein
LDPTTKEQLGYEFLIKFTKALMQVANTTFECVSERLFSNTACESIHLIFRSKKKSVPPPSALEYAHKSNAVNLACFLVGTNTSAGLPLFACCVMAVYVGFVIACIRASKLAILSHPVFKDKTECITICMPGLSSIHIVTSLVNNQQQYHEKRIKRL